MGVAGRVYPRYLAKKLQDYATWQYTGYTLGRVYPMYSYTPGKSYPG